MECTTHKFHAMGTHCQLFLYANDSSQGEALIIQAEAEIRRLEAKYTRYQENSETSRINRSAGQVAGIRVDAETAALLDYAATAYLQSDGLFDITSGVLRNAWRFEQTTLPDSDVINHLLTRVGWHRLQWESPHLTLPLVGMELDFGGVVKEYAVDAVVAICRDQGCRHGLLDMGGDIGVIGPHPDGSPWRVGIRTPWDPDRAKAIIELSAGGLATSGDYERYTEIDGVRYGHILNPKTGWPVQSMVSVSVQAPRCIIAGTASTIGMLNGIKQGKQWLAELGLPYLCINRDGSLAGSFSTDS